MFRGLTNLRTLYLDSNNLTTLPDGAFRGLTDLWALVLRNNALTTLPAAVFTKLPNLEHLGLGSNPFRTLPEDVFRSLTNLQALDLTNSSLTTLPEGVFRGLTNLQTLDLTATSLTTLPEDVFRDLSNLETLRLVNNFLTTLPEGVFRSLTNLQTLNLFYNRFLTTLPEGVFRSLTNLQTLDLSYSNLLALPESVFSSLTNLQTLRFRGGNSLTELPENVFSSLTNLRTLYLDSNNLTTLPEGVFRGLTNLQTLNLAYNSLTTLPEGVFRDLTNLQTLDLSYNFLSPPPVLLEDLRARGVEVNSDGNMDFEPTERTPISITGDSANRIDLVIVSEAYTASEMGRFAEDVNAIQAGLFSEDPFLEYADYFNIWRIEVPSNESGADRPNNTPPIMRDTAFDSFLGGGSGGLNGRKLTRVIGGMPPSTRDAVVVLINDPALSGFAGGIAVATNGGANNVFVNTVGHELGHSLGGLADEYAAGGIPCSSTYTRQEPRAANVTQETDRAAIKWRHWIDPATPIPTTTSSETTFSEGVPGLYEGAQYCEKGIFRPTLTSKMKDVKAPWKQINTEQWVQVFHDYVSPIDAWAPSTTRLTLPRGLSQTFAVTPMSPASHDIVMEWFLDGAPIGSGPSFLLDTTALAVGGHVVTVRASDDTPMVRSDPFGVMSDERGWTVTILPVESEPFEIPDRGGQSITSSGTAESLRVGYGRIRPEAGSTTPSGVAIFGFRQNGVLISEAGVPVAEPVQEARIFAEVNGPVNTGLAIANPNGMPATIDFYFTDTSGTRFGDGHLELGAHRQTAKFLDQAPFNGGPSVLGTFTFTSSVPVAVVALRGFTNAAGEFLMTTLPVAPLSSTASDTVYFPHFADGGGWATQVILVNPTDRTMTGTVAFLGQVSDTAAALPAILTLDDGRTGSDFDYSIAPRSAQSFTTSNSSGGTSSGSVRAIPEGGNAAPSGLVVFSYAPAGKTLSEAGVPALPNGSAFRVYAEAFGTRGQMGSISAGLAIANTADTSNTVTLEVTHVDGSLAVAPATLALPPSGQVARFLDEFFSLPDNFSGVLRVTSTADVAIVALRLRINEKGEIKVTTLAPSNERDPSTSEERFFPHIADSRGWSTQFSLFSGTAG